jgi:uncharacterized delta-60 repeat protein
MKLTNIGLASASLFFVFTLAAAISANPDTSFGNVGRVISSPDRSDSTFGQDYALQADGKIIAAGGGSNLGLLVARYNTNGSLDTSFGTFGFGSITFADQSVTAVAVDIQTDGKIVVGGTVSRFVNNQWVYDFAIGRFNANGTIDTTFDGDGKTTFSFVPELINNSLASENLSSLKITGDGKIIVGGSAGIPGPGGNSRFVLARLNTDGSLDTTFDGDGLLLGVQGFMYLNDLTVLPDGSFVAVGSDVNQQLRLAYKYNSNGGLVWTYSRNEINLNTSGLYGIAPQPDGKLIVVGRRAGRIAAIRLNADGTEDTSFAAPTTPFGTAVSVAVQPDGKIVANYYPSNGFGDTRNSFNITRYNPDGSLDSSFGSGGMFTAIVSVGVDYGSRILVQTDGKILVGGYSSLTNPTKYYFSMLRVLGSSAAVPRPTLFDYEGDGKADVSVYRPSEGYWYISQSSNGALSFSRFGLASDVIVPADYDNDGRTDIAVYRNTDWYVMRSATNTFYAISNGQAGDIGVPGDYNYDNILDAAVFRNGLWTFKVNSAVYTFSFGQTGDKPVPADYDGDGRIDFAFYRPSNGTWNIRNSSNFVITVINFGLADDKPVPADFDGDGKTDIAVFRPSVGDWYYLKSSNGSFYGEHFGLSDDKPVPADYDGDGKADISVFRPSGGTWYMNQSTAGFKAVNWGIASDTPTPNAYIR